MSEMPTIDTATLDDLATYCVGLAERIDELLLFDRIMQLEQLQTCADRLLKATTAHLKGSRLTFEMLNTEWIDPE